MSNTKNPKPSRLRSASAAWLACLALVVPAFAQTPQEWVNAHNTCRSQLVGYDGNPTQSPNLRWSDTLADDAQAWAAKLATLGQLQHRPMGSRASGKPDARPWGENLAFGSSPTYNPITDALGAWCSERHFFNPVSSKCSGGECGHFTQVVSQLSTEVGCATDKTAAGSTYVVCSYNPSGNLQIDGAYSILYPNQQPPVPGGPVFQSLNKTMKLHLLFSQCLTAQATAILNAQPPSGKAVTPLGSVCNLNSVTAYDTAAMTGSFPSADSAVGVLLNFQFSGKISGKNGGVAVSLSPLRAVLLVSP